MEMTIDIHPFEDELPSEFADTISSPMADTKS